MLRIILTVSALALVGCGGGVIAPKPGDEAYAPVVQQNALPPVIPNGSIYQTGRTMDLFADSRARNIGDIVTVTLQESTQASKSATSNSSKSSTANISAPVIGGIAPSIFGKPLTASFGDNARGFNGAGAANQSNSLSGQISVMVVDRLPGGVLRISGEKWLELNQGKEYIRLTGLIRDQDIDPSNGISSTKIADARIAYSGSGPIGDANRPGWLARFFNSPVWPF
ncbi:flagellar basal body L-ring protein FlgH [Litorivicinus lipolyticus]|uniref:Flagellar L-ring protein n=1 Tax=Litorivicinus lipolyticus TaxID=418701 RepID=A0A5Q2QGS5_9GAMM|nr:flagellar basal body L-ring protein FlgH [Litorivicinus lipolyticus]QGG80215.1 flagellar basal body L-ring protein FlgH [Litorivicinus lipolyticus]